jgi:predicted RNase H-like nuclease (RuvC/YqgF family)
MQDIEGIAENIAFSEEGQVQPSEQTVQDVLESPQSLEEIVQCQAREIRALNAKLEAMQKDMDSLAENQFNQLRLIADLRKKDPGKTDISRAEKIEKYLESRPDHKASLETLKGVLGIDNDLLSKTIKLLLKSPGRHSYAVTKSKDGDKRKRIIMMIPR